MKTRVKYALFMLPLLILLVAGGWPLLIGTAAISVVAVWEFYTVFENAGVKINKISGFACLALLYVIIIMDKFIGLKKGVPASQDLFMIWVGLAMFIGFAKTLFGKEHDVTAGVITSVGVLYPGFGLAHFVMISKVPGFGHFTWLVVLAAFGTDIAAYFVGSYFGKTKLCPELSPKKTVEGAVGGVLASMILCLLFGIFFGKGNVVNCVVIGLLGSIAAQMGDISASVFKRKLGIKDYSKLIPGHGGVMDRVDSLIFTAPFVFYYMTLFVK